MKKCPYCDIEIPDYVRVCPNCNGRLYSDDEITTPNNAGTSLGGISAYMLYISFVPLIIQLVSWLLGVWSVSKMMFMKSVSLTYFIRRWDIVGVEYPHIMIIEILICCLPIIAEVFRRLKKEKLSLYIYCASLGFVIIRLLNDIRTICMYVIKAARFPFYSKWMTFLELRRAPFFLQKYPNFLFPFFAIIIQILISLVAILELKKGHEQ